MTFEDLVAQIAHTDQRAKKATRQTIDLLFSEIAACLEAGEKVLIPGFGVFDTRVRRARKIRNPQTGRAMRLPAQVEPLFRAAGELKGRVRR